MDREQMLEQIQELCREVFEDDELAITERTTAADVENWDSLTHLSLIHEIETTFRVKFTMGEIQGVNDVGELVDVLAKRVNER